MWFFQDMMEKVVDLHFAHLSRRMDARNAKKNSMDMNLWGRKWLLIFRHLQPVYSLALFQKIKQKKNSKMNSKELVLTM